MISFLFAIKPHFTFDIYLKYDKMISRFYVTLLIFSSIIYIEYGRDKNTMKGTTYGYN